jgi:Na+-translocating ferredoxin:NAD+ oxidoreductase RnfD subunit
MVLSISGVLLLGALVVLLTRKGGLKVSHAIICSLFGFYLASTSLAPQVRSFTNSLAQLISGINP